MMQLGTKAETLSAIHNKLKNAKVLPQVSFSVKEWRVDSELYWPQCVKIWGDIPVIVRSSAINEDTKESSQAGKFESVTDVYGEKAFHEAVNTVIASFDDDNEDNQVLVQPMLDNVKLCGVAFTVDPNSLGNYYVVNYDESGSTSSITAGNSQDGKLLYVFKGKEEGVKPESIYRLCLTLKELEGLFGQDNLDVEFAVTEDDVLYIFQVRPLCLKGRTADYQQQYSALKRIELKIRRDAVPKPYLCGDRDIYGVMPDWNPAEMIGIHPRSLAMSLYREVITDGIWAYQRDNYGYRNLRSFPLMVDFGGLPYIDVRVSFNSFVPAKLDEEISERLVNYYLERLADDPSKHDKVEFDIVFSCYTLDLPERIQILKEYGFSDKDIHEIILALRDVTNNIINFETGLWRKDYQKIEMLEKRYQGILDSDMGEIEKIYWLIEDCKRYGTLPFAGLARGAFIAVQMLESMVKKEIISKEDYQNFMNDVSTVSSNMKHDFAAMSRKEFLKKYGHLRPGTYDINSMRYDEAPELYFDWNGAPDSDVEDRPIRKFSLSIEQMHRLKDMLNESGLNNDILGIMDFIKTVIEGREYGKFVFTRSVSKVIQMIGNMGESYGISREECAYLDIQVVRGLYASTGDVREELLKSIREGKEKFALAGTLVLPPILIDAEEVWRFYYPDTEPNYITMKKIEGKVIVLDDRMEKVNLTDKIVMIASADPGYDWIFSHRIKGFITMYGGANSHMAIRAGELGIPAVIGVGEKQFEKYQRADTLEINASARTMIILK